MKKKIIDFKVGFGVGAGSGSVIHEEYPRILIQILTKFNGIDTLMSTKIGEGQKGKPFNLRLRFEDL